MERLPSHRELSSRVAEAVAPGGAVRRLIEKDYSSSLLFLFITIVTTPAPPRTVTTANDNSPAMPDSLPDTDYSSFDGATAKPRRV